MSLETKSLPLLAEALTTLESGFDDLPLFDQPTDIEAIKNVLQDVAERMQDNYPYFHPLYVGQMLKPPHPIARLAYMLSIWINPNNHALDGGRCSSNMEKEAVAALAKMFHWDTHLGHLCSGGTMANLEALWVSRCLHPEKLVAASEQAHYTHDRICKVLQIPFKSVQCNSKAQMDMNALKTLLDQGNVGTVVITMGTTGAGAVDPLREALELQERYGFRIHADAAYGGYFTLVDNLDRPTRENFDLLNRVDSLVVDPHKHGLQPYGCGCVLFRDPSVGRFYKHDSPYTYFSSSELHLGEISLECSRPGAAAVALWATQNLLPMIPGGEFAQGLAKCRAAALELYSRLQRDDRFMSALAPELDIVIWAPAAATSSEASLLSEQMFHEAAARNLHMAVASFPRTMLQSHWPQLEWDSDSVYCLRTCLMKPEHLDWMDAIWDILHETANSVIRK
jgi:tyrosine decarboxylase/aspartate 1-decarboxylase|uniref:Aspartate aminotransferase family protein n=1 Tax=Desulfomonile tiedjei TaxID=2358 RepID=A0A7C4ASS9_9BACT